MFASAPEGTLLQVRVTPGARKSAIMGEAGGRLRIRLQAPPVEGKANRELLRFLAREFGLKKNGATLVAGEKSREKTVLLRGMTPSTARTRLKGALNEE